MPAPEVQGRKPIHDDKRQLRNEDDSQETKSDTFSDEDFEEEDVRTAITTRQKVRSVSRTPQPLKYSRENFSETASGDLRESDFNKKIMIVISAVVIVSVSLVYRPWPVSSKPKTCCFQKFINEFPKEDSSLWKKLRINVELILNKTTRKPAVFLFAHHGNKRAHQLIQEIATHSSNCFGNQLVPMEREDFFSDGSDEYGYAIEKYKNKIKEGNVMLIANLNEIPAEAARALHTICDTQTPIAENVVILLRLTVQANANGSADAIAEEALRELWESKLRRNELDPLITRVTDQVIILKS